MSSPSEEALARVVVDRYLGLRRGETLAVESWSHALGWARALLLEGRRRGAAAHLLLEDEETFFRTLALPTARRLPLPPVAFGERRGAYVYLPGPREFPRLFGLPAAELATVVGRHGNDWERAARRARLRAVRLAISTVTSTAAERYGVDPGAWEREVLRASLVPPDRLARVARSIVRRLERARRLRVRHPNGTDLSVEVAPGPRFVDVGRPNGHPRGTVWSQIPAGRVAVRLREGRAAGTWEANRPSYDRFAEPPVQEGGRFVLERGRLTEFAFDRGGPAFAAAYARGGRGREAARALVFGANPRADRAPELGAIALGHIGLLFGDDRAIGGPHRARFTYLTSLAEADIEVDGRPAWRRGRPVDGTGRVRTPRREAPAFRAPSVE